MTKIKAFAIPMIFTAAGAAAGYVYYLFFGCTNGCAITSDPVITMIYTGTIGALFGIALKK